MSKVTAEKLPPPVVKPPVTVRLTLELTQDEASALFYLTEHIGGEPAGVRGVFSGNPDSINVKLFALGVNTQELHKKYNITSGGGAGQPPSFYFNLR